MFQRYFSRGFLLVLLATFLFSFKGILIKMAYQQGVLPAQLMFIRMMMALPFYVAVLLLPLHRVDLRLLTIRNSSWIVFYGFCGYYLASFFDLTGLLYISASLERLVLYSYPGIVFLLSLIFLGVRVNRYSLISLLLIYCGLFSIFADAAFSRQLYHPQQLNGVFLVFAAAVSFSVYLLGSEIMMKTVSSQMFTCVAMISACLITALHFFSFYQFDDLLRLNCQVYWYAFLIAFLCTVLPSFLLSSGVQLVGAASGSAVGALGPVLTLAMAVFFLDERLNLWQMAGFVLVIAGVLVLGKVKKISAA